MSNKQQKLLAAIMTAVILLLAFLLLSSAVIPQRDLITERYDEIDWMRFRPRPLPVAVPEQSTESTRPAVPPAETPVVRRIDLSDLQLQAEPRDAGFTPAAPATPAKNAPAGGSQLQLDRVDISDLNSGLNLTLDQQSPLSVPPTRGRGLRGKPGDGLQAQSGSGGPAGQDHPGDGPGAELKGPEGRGPDASAGEDEIELKGFEEFGGEISNFSPVYLPLVAWMKRHPAELSPVARRFMSYKAGDLTAKVKFTLNGRSFEMLLLCVEATYEVLIVLLGQREVTYLIDQGFREQSNFLRIGKVDRLPNGEILKFSTNLEPAGSDQTKIFYRIFLSWWEGVKHEVE